MPYHQPFRITAFHSCDKKVGLKVLNGAEKLLPSNNPWDWLANGIYFLEENPLRALQYSQESAAGTQFNRKKIKIPFILGAIIELGNCLNLAESTSLQIVSEDGKIDNAHSDYLTHPLPVGKWQVEYSKGDKKEVEIKDGEVLVMDVVL